MLGQMVIFKNGVIGEVVKETESGNCYIIRIHEYPKGFRKYENDMTVIRKNKVKPYNSMLKVS